MRSPVRLGRCTLVGPWLALGDPHQHEQRCHLARDLLLRLLLRVAPGSVRQLVRTSAAFTAP
eukprot:1677710-Pyramimonas_sp.AAC.1